MLRGDLVWTTVGRYDEAVACAFAAAGDVVIDASAVAFVDSAGLALLARVARGAAAQGRAVVLLDAPHHLRRLLDVCGMASLFLYA
jgi:anti-anti-sigma factor